MPYLKPERERTLTNLLLPKPLSEMKNLQLRSQLFHVNIIDMLWENPDWASIWHFYVQYIRMLFHSFHVVQLQTVSIISIKFIPPTHVLHENKPWWNQNWTTKWGEITEKDSSIFKAFSWWLTLHFPNFEEMYDPTDPRSDSLQASTIATNWICLSWLQCTIWPGVPP